MHVLIKGEGKGGEGEHDYLHFFFSWKVKKTKI